MSHSMVAPFASVSSRSPSPLTKVNAEPADKSSGKFAGVPFDMHRFRAVFPHRWADFLRQHFQSSTHVAAFFGVDDRTARHWLEGTTAPNGATAIFAVAAIPGAMQELLEFAA